MSDTQWRKWFEFGQVRSVTNDLQFQPKYEDIYQMFKARILEELAANSLSTTPNKEETSCS